MHIKKNIILNTFNLNKVLILTLILSTFFLWIGLGMGNNMSDALFWIHSSWTTIKFEWFFIFLYIITCRKTPSFYLLWRKYRFVTLIALLWLLSISLSFLLSPFYSWQNELAFMRFFETISHFFFFIFLWDFFNRYPIDYRIIFTAIILSALILLSYFIYIHFTYTDLQAHKHVFSIRSDKLILNTHFHRIGYQIEATIAFAFAFLFSKKYRVIAILIIGVLLTFMLWLGGRAAILGAVIAFITFFFYIRHTISLKSFIRSLILFALMIFLVLYFHLLNLDYFIHAVNKTVQAGSLDHLTSGRIQLWSLILQELQDHWLLGTGPQSYFFYVNRHDDVIHAHNFILQMLGEWGIVGTSLFTILFYRAIKYGLTLHLGESITSFAAYHFAAGLVILSLSITGLFAGTYFFCQTSVYLAFAFALWITPFSNKSNQTHNY